MMKEVHQRYGNSWHYPPSPHGVASLRMGLTIPPGDVVRTGPNRLSFVTPQSYRDIYGHVKHGEKRFLKNKWYQQDEPRITRIRDPVEHGQQRRALAHAFSARALRDQETVVHQYVDMLLKQLGNLGAGGKKPVDATDAFNWLTFDVIGEPHYTTHTHTH